ncbi:inactive tyrosine-protein kinase 7-like [Pollicipes pollicipes]|uniref:inactive tyrosine-protein kinase 7-like n=1 Tax=Pollicipes pollicipes TaxID=41117 RepID=UPI001884CBFC|nr:inactive tyrosine-protein kinase 7-like [Pollicipes pollicipes]
MDRLALRLGLVGLLLTAAAALDDFYFSRHPQNLAVREGASVDLECMVSNTSFIRFYWQLDGETVLNSSRRFQRGSDLHITRVDRRRDAGHFTCIAMNVTTGFSLTSLAASLTIQWLEPTARVQLQTPPDPADVRPGQDVVLRCRADGSGELAYHWYRNGERLTRGPRLALRNNRLQLSAAEPRDGGAYSCSATNAAGTARSNQSLPLVVPSQNVTRLVLAPTAQLVRRGDPARFDCAYDRADAVSWSFGQLGPLANHGRYSVLANNSLLVPAAGPEDEGWYHCLGLRNGDDPVPQRYSAQLQLAYLKPLTSASVEPAPSVQGVHVVPEGRPCQLTCLAPEGLPPPTVRWQDPAGRDVTDRSQPPSDGSALLALDSAQVNVAGNYSCVAHNIAGSSTLHVQLLVATPPELISGPVDLVVDEGGRTELTCQFRGLQHPFTTVSWLRAGRPVRSGQVFSGNGSLVIRLTELSDAGRYQCVVNSTGFPPYRSSAALLTVKEKLKFAPRPVSRGLELGKPGRLYCRASGNTPPTVRWVKVDPDGRPLFDWQPHVRDNNGTLVFDVVQETDGGQYSCVATNPQGLINATINVTIIVTPKFLVTPSNPTEAVAGRPLLLDCQAYGRPEPSVQWDRNSRLNDLDETRFTKFENGSLYISELQMGDTARYGCIAGNSGGFSREEIQLLVRSSEAELTGRLLTPGLAADDDAMMTRTVAITVSAAAAYLLLVAGLMVWCRYRRIQRKQLYLRASAEGTSVLLAKPERAEVVASTTGAGARYVGCPRSEEAHTAGSASPAARQSPARYNSYQSIRSESSSQPSRQSRASAERRPLDRRDLQPVMPLGQGEFGDVYLARARGLAEPPAEDAIVMVKSLLHARDEAALAEFAREAELYGKLTPHAAVARLLALVQDGEPHLLVLEYSDWGDLKQFLLATRSDTLRGPPRPPPISAQHAYSLCHQLAAGVEHIHAQRFVHKDLAARNCLITSRLEVKISCGRLSRDTYSREYCRMRGQLLPLRWLPAEAALEDDFSARSDVWAWAVLCWEVFCQGELPHAALSDEQVCGR